MLRKILPSLYGCWFLHMMIVNNAFTLGLNTLTSFVYLINVLAMGALYVLSCELGN